MTGAPHREIECMKLLLLNYEFPPLGGGASPVSSEIADNLVERHAYDIDVVTMGYKGLPAYEERGPRLRIHRVPCWRSRQELCHPWEQATYLLAGYRKAVALHRSRCFDICHAHFLIPTGIIAEKLKKRFGLEYIVTSHGSDVPGFNSDRFIFLHKFTGPTLRKVAAGAKLIVAPSQYLATLILENIDAGLERKVSVIPNGIDTEKFAPGPKRKMILGTGRLLPRKGFQFLLEAVADRDIGYEVHICGDGPMMGALQEIRRRSKTEIFLHGWLDNTSPEYRALLQSAAIFVLPSLKENASISLLEAMSAGAAVVTTNISGCPETVGPEGILVEPGSVADLRAKLFGLVENEVQILRNQTAMRSRVERIFSLDRILGMYNSVISG